jgi:hypothetical protein
MGHQGTAGGATHQATIDFVSDEVNGFKLIGPLQPLPTPANPGAYEQHSRAAARKPRAARKQATSHQPCQQHTGSRQRRREGNDRREGAVAHLALVLGPSSHGLPSCSVCLCTSRPVAAVSAFAVHGPRLTFTLPFCHLPALVASCDRQQRGSARREAA